MQLKCATGKQLLWRNRMKGIFLGTNVWLKIGVFVSAFCFLVCSVTCRTSILLVVRLLMHNMSIRSPLTSFTLAIIGVSGVADGLSPNWGKLELIFAKLWLIRDRPRWRKRGCGHNQATQDFWRFPGNWGAQRSSTPYGTTLRTLW